ncbi:PREDICTED: uncharacterized protein LOC109161765 [Ipomoea nil]|uniref:uncharacterized protein LOC109161765 n=1 Tax=Ipomoea nil TaxID=35883 RepID=UPI000900F1EB|nr:PREDICTED: uncharacterized protein LOC109161765 [Ipomoea nil]
MATACLTWFSRMPLHISKGLPAAYCGSGRCYRTTIRHVESWNVVEVEGPAANRGCWVPDPRTGIYFPEGHERVMDDIPNAAATSTQTYWLRNVDGVDTTSTPHPHHHNQQQPYD